MKNEPLISVIIPVYNREKYLVEAIESVLRQTWKNVELVVIDDGSTDNTADTALAFEGKINYYYQKNRGLGAARNAGIGHASGDLIAFLDSDDLWLPEKLEKQMDALKQNPKVTMAFTMIEQFISPELSQERRSQLQGDGKIVGGYLASSLLIWKEALKPACLFPTHIQIGEFIAWYAKAQDEGFTSLLVNEILVKRRIHNDNMGIQLKDQRREYLHVVKEIVERRKKTCTS